MCIQTPTEASLVLTHDIKNRKKEIYKLKQEHWETADPSQSKPGPDLESISGVG